MNKKQYIIILLIALLCSCAAPRTQAPAPSREETLQLDAMLIEATMQRELGNLETAERQLRQLLQKGPSYGAAHYELCLLMLSQGRLDSALVYAERAVACCDTNIWYHMRLAQCLELTGRTSRLTQEWEQIVRLQPMVPDHYYQLSNAYLTANNVPKAVEALNRVERKFGITEEVSLHKSRLWHSIGRGDKAIKEIESLSDAFPREKRYAAMLAESHMQARQYSKAKQYYDRALQADPDDEYLRIGLATYYQTVDRPAEAAEQLRLGLSGTSLDTRSKMQLLTTFYPKEEFYGRSAQYALPLAEMVMSQSDHPEETAALYGSILISLGKYAEAQQQLELALTADSGSYQVWEALLISIMEQSPTDWPALRRYAERARSLFPLLPMPVYALAKAAEAEGDYPLARQWYERYLDLRPDDEEISAHLKEIETWQKQSK